VVDPNENVGHGGSSRALCATVAGVRIDALGFDAVVQEIVARSARGGEPRYVIPTNAQCILLFQRDALLRDIYRRAFLIVPDGVPVIWAASLFGAPLPGRVNGTDLLEALCAQAARHNLRVFFLGGREGAAEAAAALLEKRHPGLCICGTSCPPLGFEKDAAESEKVLEAISAARPHLLFVGFGAPKQEYWMHFNARRLGVPFLVAVGGSFDIVAGIVDRAPRWMQTAGLEWLHRLRAEPSRLWKRYIFGNAHFCILIGGQYTTQLWQRALRANPVRFQ
jgi:N-acetylglucosaminyldiphosphoundecaprenol N-acetyl-beta-D-mannosaminyltransferase